MDVLQLKEYDALAEEIRNEFFHPGNDVGSFSITPNVGRIDVEVNILRDKYDCELIKRFAEKDLRLSRKHPNMRIHFEYRFIVLGGEVTTTELHPHASLSVNTFLK